MISERNYEFGKSNIFYTVAGQGNAVVLLHGFAEDGNVWKYQIDFLKDHFRIIVPDIPGSGKSSRLFGNSRIEDYAEVVRTILIEEKIKSCTFIGHSMGGYIALAYAELYEQEMNGLGLFHSSAFADDEERKNARQKGIDFMEKYGAPAFLQQTIPNQFGSEFKADHRAEIDQLLKAAQDFDNVSLIQYYQAMMQRSDRRHILKTFAKPILFIMGEKDKTLNLQDILAQSHQPWRSHVYILKNAAHMGMWEEKEKSNTILLSYIRHVNEN